MDECREDSWGTPPRNTRAAVVSLDGSWELALGDRGPLLEVQVPGAWEAQGFSKHVDGPARYRRTVAQPARRPGERLYLELDAVSHAWEVRARAGSGLVGVRRRGGRPRALFDAMVDAVARRRPRD